MPNFHFILFTLMELDLLFQMSKDGKWAMCSNPYTSEEKKSIYTNYPL